MIFGYARVSTRGQDLESQIMELKKTGCEKFTGTKMERKEFQKALEELSEDDTLVVTKLDRFARSTVQGLETVQDLFERGIKVHILNMGIIENTPTGCLTFTIFSAFAEFERDMIVERTQEGKLCNWSTLSVAFSPKNGYALFESGLSKVWKISCIVKQDWLYS